MKIFITDLEAYNNGHLVGAWYSLPMGEDSLCECNEDVLYRGRKACEDEHHHEETFITDWECDYMDIEEYSDIYELNKIAERMESLDDDERTAVKLLLENGVVSDLNEAIEKKEDIRNTGENCMENVAYNYVQDCGMLDGMAESLQCYFDYEALGRDMDINGSYYEDEEGTIWECVA